MLYQLRATTIEGQNAFAPVLCFALVSRDTDSQNTRDQITSDARSKRARDQIVLCAFHSFLVEVNLVPRIFGLSAGVTSLT